MTVLDEAYTLSNGVTIPKLGFGTWLIDDDKAGQAVETAIACGYRYIDTAQAYENERGVGQGVRDSGLKREDVFVSTKVRAEHKDYQSAKESIEASLTRLDIGYIDLLLIHAPEPWSHFHEGDHCLEGNLEAWKAMEEAVEDGKVRAIGVSNFEDVDLDNILDHCTVKPVVNQLLTHIGNTRFDLLDYAQKHDILVEAYSPIAHGEMAGDPTITGMAERYGVSAAQLMIRYCLQIGTLPLPKASSEEHIRANADVDFVISEADMLTLHQIPKVIDYGRSSAFPVFSGR
ncbi:Aldo/keto reductase [Bifidobacterium bohemicum]|uniref:Aldo/keto reductase family oxidoreductase n=1 Tax=Bifidobacterium bohemicum DSM 22767 TaxID=1437606 RepID=A0A086ZJC8_9BIFI|nr:aldo/keto reductase [Bifidobacterium bohemicum]KFI46628.1 aldo/keto reductase family oxidoreductase [Bifidobacterium bohemicum DSM 22767]SCB77176.1 Aldo/keto reductase [Bifidobacterium bohemicum]